jgi:hypothetical protein
MSKKQFEENLNYGDCNNIICIFGSIFETTMDGIEKTLNKIINIKK